MRTRDKQTIRRLVNEHGAKTVHEIVDSIIVIAAPHDHLSALGMEAICKKHSACDDCPLEKVCLAKKTKMLPYDHKSKVLRHYTVEQVKKAHNIK